MGITLREVGLFHDRLESLRGVIPLIHGELVLVGVEVAKGTSQRPRVDGGGGCASAPGHLQLIDRTGYAGISETRVVCTVPRVVPEIRRMPQSLYGGVEEAVLHAWVVPETVFRDLTLGGATGRGQSQGGAELRP